MVNMSNHRSTDICLQHPSSRLSAVVGFLHSCSTAPGESRVTERSGSAVDEGDCLSHEDKYCFPCKTGIWNGFAASQTSWILFCGEMPNHRRENKGSQEEEKERAERERYRQVRSEERQRLCVFASLNCVILRLDFQSSRRLIEFIGL